MKSAAENLEPTRVKLTVEVPFEELKPALDKAYKEISSQVNVPGFRKGKVPPRIIDQRIGRGAVIEQAVNEELGGLYSQAVAEQEINPLGRPTIEVTEVPSVTGALSGRLVFVAEVDVRPDFELPDLAGLELTVEGAEVSDDDVEERLTTLRQRFGTLVGVERAIAEGDFVTLDLKAEIDGDEVDSVSGVSYEVGSGTMLEGLDEALTGKKADETANFTSPLAGGDHAGKEADVTVTPTAVKERELPEADDDFAQMASEFDTIGELRDDLRTQAAKEKSEGQAIEARDKLLEHLRETVEFPLPAGVIEEEINNHLQQEGKEPGDPHGEEIREEVTGLLRDQLLLDALSERFEVDVTQEDLFNFLVASARQYGMDPNQFIQAASQTGQLPAFMGEIARNKALAVALRDVVVKDGSGEVLDLSEFIGSEEKDLEAAGETPTTVAPEDVEGESAERAEEADTADEAPATKAPAKKSATAKDGAEAGEGEEKPAPKKPAAKKAPAKKAPAKKAEAAEAGEGEEKPAPKKPAAKKAPAKKPATAKDGADAADGEDKPAPKKPAAKKAPAKKSPAKKAEAAEAGEGEEKPAPKKPAAKKAPAKKPATAKDEAAKDSDA